MIALPTDFDPTAENILLDYKVVPLEQIHPNPWNPNQMTDAEENALAESMEKYGDFDPILVRPHPDLEGAFQIIDGEHRWKTRVADGKKFALVNIRHSSDQEAQHLTGITILDRGTPDKLKLAQLLAEVEAMSSIEETLDGLPMAKNELEELLALAKHDWRSDQPRNYATVRLGDVHRDHDQRSPPRLFGCV
jgi:ParB-like chromosome segregation protein Spo0J